MNEKPSAREIIDLLGLQPMEAEGGMFRSTYSAGRAADGKNIGSAIYYFISGGAFSHMHRLQKDEVYHFYFGEPVELLQLSADGCGQRVVLGADIRAGQRPQHVVPAGCWQGSRLIDGGTYALMGTTMSPGFMQGDREHAQGADLIKQYPQYADLIGKLTGTLVYWQDAAVPK